MTAQLQTPPIAAAELQKLLADVDGAALLVPPRLLRRVIKQDCDIGGVGFQVPHRKTYTIGRDSLLAIADHADLGVNAQRELPAHLLLLACPETWLNRHGRDQALVRFWRLLFHARLDLAVEGLIRDGKLDDARIRQFIHRIGPVEVEEVFRVLRHENFLLPPCDLHICFTEFVALFFELRYFARHLLHRYFPGIEDLGLVESILSEVVDAAPLFKSTRLAGAPEPLSSDVLDEDEPRDSHTEKLPPPAGMPSAEKCRQLMLSADAAATRGNVVRGAVLRLRAADVAPPELIDAARRGALIDLERLVTRLQAALELHDREVEEWRAALPALLGPASQGVWPHSARLLYDLQKVCIDYERDLYALDVVEWVVSVFRKPIKRAVPLQAEVLLVKHLRSAAARLAKTQISDEDRRRLGILLRAAIHHCEERLREKIRPILTETLVEVGFQPANQAEQVALRKIVEELLDRVSERGFLTMGDLRDAISRNQLKLPDTSIGEIVLGDRLLKANRKLAITLDGVYRRGEIYLRFLQRFSSMLFGTVLGRLLTIYLILPFGGAFALLIFWQEMTHLGHSLAHLVVPAAVAPPPSVDPVVEMPGQEFDPDDFWDEDFADLPPVVAPPPQHPHPSFWAIGILGVLLFLILHVPWFRTWAWELAKLVWKGIRGILFDIPAAFFALGPIQGFFGSTPVVFFRRRLLIPLLLAGIAALVCSRVGIPGPFDDLAAFGITFVLAFLLLGSRWGRLAEESATDWVARNWYWLRVDVLPGLVGLILFAFKETMDRIDRLLYSVDEWLRFRPGDSKLALFYKPILGLFWFFFTYLIRVVINLFVEPTVNPIKHFPAVTVGAKMIVPFYIDWTRNLTLLFVPYVGFTLGQVSANVLFALIPGICGFAVWEFKENWKLYRATRRRFLRPVMIGHHGETMLRLMKPGFHSGTLPKLFAKLRQAERHGDGRKIHRCHESLHHVADSIRHFAEREMLFLLEASKSWGGLKLLIGEVKLATNRVRIELRCPDLDESGLWLLFEERSGWLEAAVQKLGWLSKLNAPQLAAFQTALAGLYKLAGAHLVREQVEMCLPSGSVYRIDGRGMVLVAGGDFTREQVHSLVSTVEVPNVSTNGEAVLPLDRVLYDRTQVAWDEWVSAWEADKEGKPPELPVLQRVRLLPPLVPGPVPAPVAVR